MKPLKHILSESASLLLLEYDREKTMKNHGDKAYNVAINRTGEHDPYLSDIDMIHHGLVRNHKGDNGPEAAKHELFSQFEESDPTPNKKYVQHIARIYGNGGVSRHEDIYARMKPALRKYDDLTKRKLLPPEHRDIGRIKSLSDLEDIVDAHSDKLSNREQDAAHHEEMKNQSTITDHGTFTHTIPHTVESAAHFGKGTRWCTATEDPDDSMFNYYNKHGALHILTPKQPAYPGEKYQVHYDNMQRVSDKSIMNSTAQVMNEKDEAAHEQLKQNHPEMFDHMDRYYNSADNASSSADGIYHHEPWVVKKSIENNKDNLNQNHLDHLLNHKNVGIRAAAETRLLPHDDERPYHTANHVIDTASSFEDADVLGHPQHFRAILDRPSETGFEYKVAHHDNVSKLPQEYIDRLVNHKSDDVRWHLANNPKAPLGAVEKLVNDKSPGVRTQAKTNLLNRRWKSENKTLRSIINRNPTLD